MQPILSSLNIQNIVSKLPIFLTLQRLVHKVCGHIFCQEVLVCEISFFNLIREEKISYVQMSCPFTRNVFISFCSRIALLLSWYKWFSLTLYPCDFRKTLVHNIRLDTSSVPTNSASVMIFVSSFWFCDTDTIATFTIVNVAPVCNLKSKCTANASSKYHFRKRFFLTLT